MEFYTFSENLKNKFLDEYVQGWGAGAGCFWLLGAGAGAAWKKNQEPEPLGKKSGAGAEADKKLAGSSALQEDKKHREIVL